MKLKSTVISQFIQTNAVAYAAAADVFHTIESNTFAETLAASGVIGADVKVFAVVFVAKESGVLPHEYRGAWTFTKDSAEHSRVKYLVAVVSGAAARKAGARKSAKIDPVEVLLKGYKALTPAQKKAFIAAI
jgi:hypothetical protein